MHETTGLNQWLSLPSNLQQKSDLTMSTNRADEVDLNAVRLVEGNVPV